MPGEQKSELFMDGMSTAADDFLKSVIWPLEWPDYPSITS